jgi:hypothetical protein
VESCKEGTGKRKRALDEDQKITVKKSFNSKKLAKHSPLAGLPFYLFLLFVLFFTSPSFFSLCNRDKKVLA